MGLMGVRSLVSIWSSDESLGGFRAGRGARQISFDKDPFGCMDRTEWEEGSGKVGEPGRRQLELYCGSKGHRAGSRDW